MPPILFATFLASSLLTLLLPAVLVVSLATYLVRTLRHVHEDTPETAAALPPREVIAAAVEAGVESAQPQPPPES